MDFPHLALKRAVARQVPARDDADPNTVLAELLQAKKESDRKNYPSKHDILRRLIKASPDEFVIDSEEGGIYGITHVPSGFKIHMPKVAAPPELKRAQPDKQRTAALITGNPAYIQDNPQAVAFYAQIEEHLKSQGYDVTRDPGEPYTEPSPADLWVGHSRGADRLRFAPEETRTVALGSPGGVNHPEDLAMKPGDIPTEQHYILTDEMKQVLSGLEQDPVEQGRKLALGIYKNAGRLARSWTRGLGGPIESAAQNFPTLDDYTSEMLMPPRPSEAPFYAPKLSFWQNLKNVFKRPVERREKDRRNSESLWRVQQAIGDLDRPQPSYTRHGYAALMQATKRKQNFMVNMIQRNPNEFRLLSDNGNMTSWLHMSSGREFKVPTNPAPANRMNVSVSEPDMKRWVQAQRYRTGKMTGTQARRYMGS